MRLAKGILLFLIVVLMLLLSAGAYLYYLNTPSAEIPENGKVFKVLKGENLSAIADRLQQDGLIRSKFFLVFFSRLNNSETSFKSGYFKILPGDSTIDVHNLLISGYQEQVKVTYGIPAENLEGYLFPDTYFFPRRYPAYGVVEEMVATFFSRLAVVAPEAGDWDPDRVHDTVIIASIVEREYRLSEEAPLIASVFYNRLEYNIGLESCATLEYIITDIQNKPHPSYLSIEDKSIDSPYNTYKWAGLPPGPISNPGMVALEAAFQPQDTNFYYFVLKDPNSGEHYFSEDLQEHNWAKYYYLKQVETGG
jgi:UPF0755 protein